MNHKIAAYGLAEGQISHLEAALPEKYKVVITECETDLIVTNAVCSIVDATKLDRYAMNTLIAYYTDVDDQLDETVVWLGAADLPELPPFVRYDNFLALLTELDNIIAQAQTHYDKHAERWWWI